MQKHDILDTDKIFPLLLKLSIPTMIGGMFSALYNIVDSIFVGHFIGVDALAALTISHSIQLMFIGFAALFSVGSGVLISKSLGAKDYQYVNSIIVSTTVSVFAITIISSILLVIFLKNILLSFEISASVYNQALIYISTIVIFSFVVLLNGIFSGMLRAKGLSRLAMNLSLVGALLNILLDALFIVVFSWGIFGAAFATVLSQIIVFFGSLYYLQTSYQLNPFNLQYLEKNFKLLWQIILIGFPSGIKLLVIALSILITNKVLTPYGVNAIATYGIVSRIISLVFMPIQGCNFGTQPIISYNFGAKRFDRLQNTLKTSLLMMSVIGFVGTFLFQYTPSIWFKMFTEDQQIITHSKEALAIVGSLFFLFGIYMLLSGFVQSVGYVKEALFLSLLRPVVMITLLYVLPNFFGILGVWYSTPVADIFNVIISSVIAYKVYKNIKINYTQSISIEGEYSA